MRSSMTSPGYKVGQILKVIYLRQYWSQSVEQKLKNVGMLMAIFLVYSTSGITSGKQSLSRAQNSDHFWKFWNIKHSFNLTSDMKRSSQIMPIKSIFMMMTSSMTSQGGLKVGPLYSFINEKITFFMITKQRAKISSLNFLCICIIRLWLQLYEYIFMTSLMTSPGHKIGQILKLIYLRQYLNYSVDQKLKMSEMLTAIFLVYSPSGITSGKKSLLRAQKGGHFENFEILNKTSTWPQIWKDRPKLCKKKYFHDHDVIIDVTGWPQSVSLYSCFGEVGSGSKLQGQCIVNKCQQCHNCLSRLYMPKSQWITLFEIAGQRSTSQAYWVSLALISNIANYLKYNYLLDCDGIDNVTLRLWKFSDFCSTHCRRRGWWYHVPHSSLNLVSGALAV